MKKSVSNLIILVLATFGSLLSLALTWEHYHPSSLPCSIHGAGCSGTLSSSYSTVGPIPTSLFGFGMYVLFVLACWRRKGMLAVDRHAEEERARTYAGSEPEVSAIRPTAAVLHEHNHGDKVESGGTAGVLRSKIKRLDLMIWALALLGFCISWWLQAVSIWELHSFCPYCFTSAVTVSLISILAGRDYLLDGRALNGEQKLLVGVIGFVIVMMGFIVGPEIQQIVTTAPYTPTIMPPLLRDVLVRPGLNVKGDAKAKYTLVEFADYRCPHCKEASEKIPAMMENHPEIKLIYRNYPLAFPKVKFLHSDKASVAAEAAAQQGSKQFWAMHDYLFAHQPAMENLSFTDEMFVGFASQIGLDPVKFKRDFDDPKMLARVIQDHDDGDAAGMERTPTFFFVTPDRVTRISSLEDLQKIVGDAKDDAWK